jgi:hypothetical protein
MNIAGRSRGLLSDKPLIAAFALGLLLLGSIILFPSGFGLGLDSWLSSLRSCNREVVTTAQEAAGIAKKLLADRDPAIFTIGLKSWKQLETDSAAPQRWELELLILSHLRQEGKTTSFSTAVKFVIVNPCGQVLRESDSTTAPEVESVSK